jgi:hypothetical protein
LANLHRLTESALTQIRGFNIPLLKIGLLRKIRLLDRVLLILRLWKVGLLLQRVLLKPRLLKIRLLEAPLLRPPVDIIPVAFLSGCARNGE